MENLNRKYERASKRVKEYMSFYRHVKIFIVINGLLYLLKTGALNRLMPEGFPTEPYYFDWVISNILIWGIILVVHGLYTFRYKIPFLKHWEERQIQKYMEQEEEDSSKFK
ncbi:2TM domain-containing protein [Allomuricauda sp. M10]|uniref:2TM domain-containing protein n=1 Tax=Allomuricauda sp. M10 TaxID=2683292 RepID=UPI001D196650|nr:2TM domain-containing protein [Muricauda sp. M10]